ncbi:MAG: hypothetical protein JW809_19340 [Pirellulales bacterium]|nr:hypothetical protein [Pirellulales bacterium]
MIRQGEHRRRFVVKWLVGVGIATALLVLAAFWKTDWVRQRLGDLTVVRMWFGGGGEQVRSISFAPNGECLAAGYSFPPLTCIWNVESGARFMVVREKKGESIKHVSYSPDGKLLAVGVEQLSDVGTTGCCVRIRDACTGALIRELDMPVLSVFSPDGKLLAAGDGIRAMPEGTRLRQLTNPDKFWLMGLGFSRDGSLLAAGGFVNDGHFHPSVIALVWDVKTGRIVKSRICPNDEAHETCPEGKAVDFHPDGKQVAIGTIDDAFYVWNIETDEVKIIRREGGRWWAVKYSPDGQLIAASGAGGIVLIWDMKNNKELCALERHVGSVYAVAFSPRGNLLATGGMDGTVRLWAPTGHSGKAWGLARELVLGE